MAMSCSPEFLLHRAEALRSLLSGQSQNRVPRAFPLCGLAGESWDRGTGMEVSQGQAWAARSCRAPRRVPVGHGGPPGRAGQAEEMARV